VSSYVNAVIAEAKRRGFGEAHFVGSDLWYRDPVGRLVPINPVEALDIAQYVLSEQNSPTKGT
jgi:hypothetical protein